MRSAGSPPKTTESEPSLDHVAMPPKKVIQKKTAKGPKGAQNKRKPRRSPVQQKRSPAQKEEEHERERDFTRLIHNAERTGAVISGRAIYKEPNGMFWLPNCDERFYPLREREWSAGDAVQQEFYRTHLPSRRLDPDEDAALYWHWGSGCRVKDKIIVWMKPVNQDLFTPEELLDLQRGDDTVTCDLAKHLSKHYRNTAAFGVQHTGTQYKLAQRVKARGGGAAGPDDQSVFT